MPTATNAWYVFTGGPSTGKTTLLNELAKHGYATMPEAARSLIDQALAKGTPVSKLRSDEEKFQHEVFKLKQKVEAKLDPGQMIILDRGLHDTAAYLLSHGFPVPPWISQKLKSVTYQKVFLFEPLSAFVADYSRTENQDYVIRLNQLLQQVYKDAGMKPIRVPAMPIKQRLDLILAEIG